MNRTTRSGAVALLALAGFLVPAGTAYAAWSATATATVQVGLLPTAPSAPPVLASISCSGSGNTLTLSWAALPPGTLGYRLYQSVGNGGYAGPLTPAGPATPTSVTLSESDMRAGESNGWYTLVLRSYNAGGESPNSSPLTLHFQSKKASCS